MAFWHLLEYIKEIDHALGDLVLNVVGRHIEIVNATAQLLFLCKVSHMKDSKRES